MKLLGNRIFTGAETMSKILCSTGALLKYGGDYKILEPLSGQLECDGYEFMMDRPYYEEVDELKRYFQETGLHIPVVHCEKSIGEHISRGGQLEWSDAFFEFLIQIGYDGFLTVEATAHNEEKVIVSKIKKRGNILTCL